MSKVSAVIVNYNAGSLLGDAISPLRGSSDVTKIIDVDNVSGMTAIKEIEKLAEADP